MTVKILKKLETVWMPWWIFEQSYQSKHNLYFMAKFSYKCKRSIFMELNHKTEILNIWQIKSHIHT